MGKKVKEYKAGDFIFAKVKGYPAWPARVRGLNGKKYFVYFYGTGEIANLPPNMIFDYAENKTKFLTKTVKRKDFNDGVKQIEHDFLNNVPLEDVLGLNLSTDETAVNDVTNDAEETINDTMETTADETNNTTQNETGIEDSDEGAPLIIDEGKKGGRKSKVETTPKATKPAKEPKTPRSQKGAAKKDEEEPKEKKDEELVSRSGRKIRPKRYVDEQTEENTALPSPAPKKRRANSPEKTKATVDSSIAAEKSATKSYNAVAQSEIEDLKEPFNTVSTDDADKENILIAYLPSGQYVGIKLFQGRPNAFKTETVRLQWDKRSAANAIRLKFELEKGEITPQSVVTQLETDLNLTDEEKASLDKEREIEERRSRVQFLKTEMKLIELDAKIKTCLSLEKADTDLCLKLLDDLMELEVRSLMLLKHPTCLETVKRMRCYVGNTPSWDLSEDESVVFSKKAHLIRKKADKAYCKFKELFTTPEGLSFWEYFSERVVQFKKCTARLTPDELLELVHEPIIEMSMPTSHTMSAAIEAANEDEAPTSDEVVDDAPRKTPSAKKKTPTPTVAPNRTLKRQRKHDEKTTAVVDNPTEQATEETVPQPDQEETSKGEKEKKDKETEETKKDKEETKKDKEETKKEKEETKKEKEKDKKEKEAEEIKETEEPKAKRGRESTRKTEAPVVPKSPGKRKAKS